MTESDQIISTLEACIELETSIASLYRLFAETSPEDQVFWSDLYLEEKSHATILRTVKDSFTKRQLLPEGILPGSPKTVKEVLATVKELIKQCEESPPSRERACELAIELESTVAEEHYDQFMSDTPQSNLEDIFQQLNRDDKDHARRITGHLMQISH